MPPKRKRPAEPAAAAAAQPAAAARQSSATRRATRQTPVHPPPVPASMLSPQQQPQSQSQPQPQKRSGRGRQTVKVPPPPLQSSPPSIATKTKTKTTTTSSSQATPLLPPQSPLSPGTIRVAAPLPSALRGGATAAADVMGTIAVKENGGSSSSMRPSDLVAPEITYHVPQANHHGRQSSLVRPHGPSAAHPPPRLHDKMQQQQPHVPPPLPPVVTPVVTPVPPPKPPTLPASDRAPPPPLPHQPPRADRNIDKVVLGNLCFRTWYPSYYGKAVLGDTSSSSSTSSSSGNAKGGSKDAGAKDAGGKAQSRRDKDHQPPMLERLYVCPSCFKYAKELVAWWGHVRVCQQRGYVPGRKIYVHPKGRRTVQVAAPPHDNGKAPGPKKRRGDGGVRYIDELVQDKGEWSIWEVDGENDVLFCQNLSLFAKLFLDNKSVFFDVTGFNYFLLVYTPPADGTTPQITGFFSKEKMSWDNNNLACILVFPPWQRKGLGALLMGASYEISRREGIMGGPEKPISDLGKKGYKRFWSGEIARWLLSLDTGQGSAWNGHETIVDVEDCSRGTWISPEDCLGVLREMGIVEDAGMGWGKPEKTEEPQPQAPDEEKKKKQLLLQQDGAGGGGGGGGGGGDEGKQQGGRDAEEDKQQKSSKKAGKKVARVRVDKEAVRRYVAAHRIPLDRTCDPDGFVEGYAMKAKEKEKEKAQSEDAEAREEEEEEEEEA